MCIQQFSHSHNTCITHFLCRNSQEESVCFPFYWMLFVKNQTDFLSSTFSQRKFLGNFIAIVEHRGQTKRKKAEMLWRCLNIWRINLLSTIRKILLTAIIKKTKKLNLQKMREFGRVYRHFLHFLLMVRLMLDELSWALSLIHAL